MQRRTVTSPGDWAARILWLIMTLALIALALYVVWSVRQQRELLLRSLNRATDDPQATIQGAIQQTGLLISLRAPRYIGYRSQDMLRPLPHALGQEVNKWIFYKQSGWAFYRA